MDGLVFYPFVAFCTRYHSHNNVDAQTRSCLTVVQKIHCPETLSLYLNSMGCVLYNFEIVNLFFRLELMCSKYAWAEPSVRSLPLETETARASWSCSKSCVKRCAVVLRAERRHRTGRSVPDLRHRTESSIKPNRNADFTEWTRSHHWCCTSFSFCFVFLLVLCLLTGWISFLFVLYNRAMKILM